MGSIASIPDIPTRQVVLFRLATRIYGVDLEHVREIVPFRRATRLPGAPEFVCGLINLRGTVITVIDLGARLDGGPSVRTGGSVILVEHGSKLVGLAVDEALEVQHLADADLDAAPSDGESGGAVRAVGRLGDTVVILLDAEEIVRQVLL